MQARTQLQELKGFLLTVTHLASLMRTPKTRQEHDTTQDQHRHDNTRQKGVNKQRQVRKGGREGSQARASRSAQEVFRRVQGGTGGLSQGGSDSSTVEGQGGAGGMDQEGSSRAETPADGQGGAGGTDQESSSRAETPADDQGGAGSLACRKGGARIKDRAGRARSLGGVGIRARSLGGTVRAGSLGGASTAGSLGGADRAGSLDAEPAVQEAWAAQG